MQETWVQSLDQEDPLEKEMATTVVFLPGEVYGQRSLASYSPWDCKESDATEQTNTFQLRKKQKEQNASWCDETMCQVLQEVRQILLILSQLKG